MNCFLNKYIDNKKALYESIMASVAREVKKTLNEADNSYEK